MVAWKENTLRLANNLQVSRLLNDTVLEKRQYYVKEIISTIWFLAKNECAFRGNWDAQNHDETGLFQNLFKYMLQKDEYLRKCQDAMPKNALYTSPDIQNEFKHTIADCLRESIVEEMKKASFYTLMVDGAKDKRGNEILSIALRYVNDAKPVETLLSFEKTNDLTANGFLQVIVSKIEEHGIDHKKLLSQCFDGASVMSGHRGGLQTLIQNHYNQEIPYVHCFSHRLHLVVVEIVTQNDTCRLFFDQVKLLHDFFKRHKIRELYEGTNIPLIIEQRWSGHHKAIQRVKDNINQLVESLTKIKDGVDHNLGAEDVALAIGLLKTIVNRKFVFLLEILCKLFGIMEPANQILQQRDTGYRNAMPIMEAVKSNVHALRNDSSFNEIMSTAQQKLDQFSYEPEHPIRRRRRSTLLNDSIVMCTIGERDSVDEDTSLKRCSFEIIDSVTTEMTRRFDNNNDILLAVAAADDFLSEDFNIDSLQPLTKLNLTLPSSEEVAVARTFLLTKKNEEKDDKSKKKFSILQTLLPFAQVFPSTYRLFEAIDTFGGSTSMNEASFSALSRIDTIRRNSMTDQRLRDLSFIAFEKKRLEAVNIDTILRKFAEKNRRIQLF